MYIKRFLIGNWWKIMLFRDMDFNCLQSEQHLLRRCLKTYRNHGYNGITPEYVRYVTPFFQNSDPKKFRCFLSISCCFSRKKRQKTVSFDDFTPKTSAGEVKTRRSCNVSSYGDEWIVLSGDPWRDLHRKSQSHLRPGNFTVFTCFYYTLGINRHILRWWLGCPITSETHSIYRFHYHSQEVIGYLGIDIKNTVLQSNKAIENPAFWRYLPGKTGISPWLS